ncbi:hypothetical protein ABEB36_001986 [Hypothenemus hampei]|uniref:Protein CIP2A n=1 Tax=Hypothenemus hampei TaxID=57062 RepID=A0ABD1FJ03_HYPHA
MDYAGNSKEVFNSINNDSRSLVDSKYVKIKELLNAIESYLENLSETHLPTINQFLRALSLTLDLSIFDPHKIIISKLFINIYDLMNLLESTSLTSWYCVDLLLNALKNSVARRSIQTTYQFLPCLSRMANDQLTMDRKVKLLTLIQNMCCGSKVCSCPIPYMENFLRILSKWIERQDYEISSLALGVLVTLCYKNSSNIYILQKTIDLKKFIRLCLTLKGPIVEFYVCFIIIILENVSGDIPPVIFPKLIESTFVAVIEAFQKNDSVVLKQIVEYFIKYPVLSIDFDKYQEQVEIILEKIEKSNNAECLSETIKLINYLIEARVPLTNLFPRLTLFALKWVQETTASYQALSLLKSVITSVSNDDSDAKTVEAFLTSLPGLILLLKVDDLFSNIENVKRCGALLQLFRVLIPNKVIGSRIIQELNEDMFRNIFFPLLYEDSFQSRENTCSIQAINLFVYALTLIRKLAEFSESWKSVFIKFISNRQIHVILAQAICLSSVSVKKSTLELSDSCSEGVSEALELIVKQGAANQCEKNTGPVFGHGPNDMPLYQMPLEQQERLNSLLEHVENCLTTNDPNNLPMSELMELYNFKFSHLVRSEKIALCKIAESDRLCAHLQNRVNVITLEITRLQQSAYHTQAGLESEKRKNKALNTELRKKENQVTELGATLKETESKLAKLQQLFNRVEENCRRLEKNEVKKDELLKNANESVKNLSQRVDILEECIVKNEQTMDEMKRELELKTSILDNITKMASSQSKL